MKIFQASLIKYDYDGLFNTIASELAITEEIVKKIFLENTEYCLNEDEPGELTLVPVGNIPAEDYKKYLEDAEGGYHADGEFSHLLCQVVDSKIVFVCENPFVTIRQVEVHEETDKK